MTIVMIWVGILISDILSKGVKNLVSIEQYKEGLISLGKMAELLSITKQEAMHLLNRLNIEWLGYEDVELDKQMQVAKKCIK